MKHLKEFENFANESFKFNADYWEAYNDPKSRPGSQPFFHYKERIGLERTVREAIEDWNYNASAEGQPKLTKKEEKEILSMAKQFYSAKGWVSISVIQAMIMQN